MNDVKLKKRYIPFTPSGSMLAHIEKKTERKAWKALCAEHPVFNTKSDLKRRGYTVERAVVSWD